MTVSLAIAESILTLSFQEIFRKITRFSRLGYSNGITKAQHSIQAPKWKRGYSLNILSAMRSAADIIGGLVMARRL